MIKDKDEQPKSNYIIEKLGGNKVIANKLVESLWDARKLKRELSNKNNQVKKINKI